MQIWMYAVGGVSLLVAGGVIVYKKKMSDKDIMDCKFKSYKLMNEIKHDKDLFPQIKWKDLDKELKKIKRSVKFNISKDDLESIYTDDLLVIKKEVYTRIIKFLAKSEKEKITVLKKNRFTQRQKELFKVLDIYDYDNIDKTSLTRQWKVMLKKYHPDVITIEQQDIATKKTQEINQAYDEIIKSVKF